MSELDSHRGFIGEHDLYRGRIESKHDFPPVLFESVAAGKGVIRLHVAAIIVCLDHAPQTPAYDKQTEQEIELFVRGDGADPNHADDNTWSINPHEYLDREISGTLRPLHLQLLTALIASVEKGELKPLFARRSLAGAIDPVRTWIETDHLLNWCEERDLYLDYCFDEYVGGERRVEEATFHTASSEREQLENRTIREQAAEKFSGLSEDQTLAHAVKLMADNAVLRRELDNKQARPLVTRERNVLLTIIAALCDEQKIDYTKPSKAAVQILDMVNRHGLKVSESAIEGHLKKIPDALETRAK